MAEEIETLIGNIIDVSKQVIHLLDTHNIAQAEFDESAPVFALISSRESAVQQLFSLHSATELDHHSNKLMVMQTLDTEINVKAQALLDQARSETLKYKKNQKAISCYQNP